MSTQLREISALIIGGGPTGQVIGKHLALAGVNAALYLKQEYAGPADLGFYLYRTPTWGKRENLRWDDFKIYTTPEQLSAIHADHVYVCLAEQDLRTGWLEQVWPHFRHAYWIFLQPGIDVKSYVSKIVPERFVVQMQPGFLAYEGPLGDEERYPRGTVFWHPPGGASLFDAIDAPTGVAVSNILQKGGLKVGIVSNFEGEKLQASTLLLPFLMTLETHGWSFERLREDKRAIARLCVAVNELVSGIRARTGFESSRGYRLQKPWFWRLILKYGPNFAPIPIEDYFRERGTRQRQETELMLEGMARLLTEAGVKPIALADIRKEWLQSRPRFAASSGSYDRLPMMNAGAPATSDFAVPNRYDDDGVR